MPGQAGLTIVPLANRISFANAAQFARDCTTFWTPYDDGRRSTTALFRPLPFVRVTERSGGTFFHSVTPDAYSAIALCSVLALHYSTPSIQCEWRIGFEQRASTSSS